MLNERYSREEMRAVWEDDNRYHIWLELENLVCEALESIGEVPEGVSKKIRSKAKYDLKKVEQLSHEIKHDVHAFLESVISSLGDDGRYYHLGVTSFDIMDTAFAVQLKQAADIIIGDLDSLLFALERKIQEHKSTLCVGRSHGVHSEPMTYGLKLANYYASFQRSKRRMMHAREDIKVCMFSGAIGTYASIDPRVEEYVADKIGFKTVDISSKIISRDRHAMFFATLAIIAASIENFSADLRLQQRTEAQEVEEKFDVWNKSSSAMPHKHNPVASEHLMGISRMVRSVVIPAIENVTIWDERDVSYGPAEDLIAPSCTALIDYAINSMTYIVDNMVVHPDNMVRNLEMTRGLVFSQHLTIELIKGGMSRDYARKMVQQLCSKVMESEVDTFFDIVVNDETVNEYLSREKIRDIFDYSKMIKRSILVVDRVLSKDKSENA